MHGILLEKIKTLKNAIGMEGIRKEWKMNNKGGMMDERWEGCFFPPFFSHL